MSRESQDVMRKLVEHAGPYPEEAFYFVRDGLSHAAQRVHGAETPAHRKLQAFLLEEGWDWSELIHGLDSGTLPLFVSQLIEEAGGCEKLDRHITGRELCWGLHDYALTRWGRLARPVLESWNIRCTADFGRIVFSFIECELMQKQPSDNLADFEDVYCFEEAFDGLPASVPPELQSEDSVN